MNIHTDDFQDNYSVRDDSGTILYVSWAEYRCQEYIEHRRNGLSHLAAVDAIHRGV